MEKKYNKIVLAYSGGLDTSVLIPWLKENYGCEVVAVSADVGQGAELIGLEEKALKTGASKLYIEDLKKEFVDEYIIPTMKAGAAYEQLPAGNLLRASHYSKTDCRDCEKEGPTPSAMAVQEKEMIRSVSSWQSKRLRLRWM